MPHVNVRIFPGRDSVVKEFLARRIVDSTAEILCVSRDAVHVVFTETSAQDWAIGPRLVASRTVSPTAQGPAVLRVNNLSIEPTKLQEYLAWRRHSLYPAMSTFDGFLGSTMVTTEDPSRFTVVDKWVSAAAQQEFDDRNRHATEERLPHETVRADPETNTATIVDVWSASPVQVPPPPDEV